MRDVDFLLSALEEEVTPDGAILLGRLRAIQDELDYWPEQTFAAALEVFGRAVYARTGRTGKALDRRISHALRVWDEKYGPLNPEQEGYADAVLAAAIRQGGREAGSASVGPWSYVQAKIGRAVNHERVDAGFKARADARIDVSAEVADVLGAGALSAVA